MAKTIAHMMSCDCQIKVELKEFLFRCNLHVNTRKVIDVYAHNKQFTNPPQEDQSRLKAEKERIRQLKRPKSTL